MYTYSVYLIAVLMGIKHAIEPDHIVAISTIVCKSKSFSKASLLGLVWGIGHTLTLFIVGMIAISFKHTISQETAVLLEKLVGVMIGFLGIKILLNYKNLDHTHIHKSSDSETHKHSHPHTHNHEDHLDKKSNFYDYFKSMIVGLVHGLAGSAAMIILTISTVSSAFEGAMFILCFGIGTIISMFMFTTILGIPFVKSQGFKLNQAMNIVVGLVSITFSAYYILA